MKVQNPYDRLVEIKWIDSRGGHVEWQDLEDYPDSLTLYMIHSVGWVIREDDLIIHLAASVHIDPNDGQIVFCGDVQIPRIAIQDQWEIT